MFLERDDWTAVRDYRVIETSDPVNYRYDKEGSLIHLEEVAR